MIRLTLLLTMLLALPARAAPLLVAAASDLSYCIVELGAAFTKQAPQARVKASTGSSGNLYGQIRNGAPFDVFLSADMAYPAQLARDGAADPATLTPYAIGRIVLWTLDARFDVRQGMDLFDDARLTRVALANPAFAPYGRAAKQALVAAGKWPAVQAKLVVGENISQAVQFVQTGNAQVGIVSLASVLSPRLKKSGNWYLLPDSLHEPIVQGAVVTAHGKNNPLAARFVQFLSSPVARQIFQRNGFGLPPQVAARG